MDLPAIFKDVPKGTRKLGVVGHPLGHTLSPAMQTAAIETLGFDAVYREIEVRPDEWDDFIQQAEELPLDGFNVTVPFKEAAHDSFGQDAEDASVFGSVNTVRLRPAPRVAASTDGEGLLADFAAQGIELDGKKVVLLGAGGSARAILYALGLSADPAEVVLVNRTVDKAEKLCREFNASSVGASFRASFTESPGEAQRVVQKGDLLINATSAGLAPGSPPVDAAWLHPELAVYDLVYHRETELMAAARKTGARVSGGLGMLVEQGAKSFEIWFGEDAPVDEMRRAAEEELSRRS